MEELQFLRLHTLYVYDFSLRENENLKQGIAFIRNVLKPKIEHLKLVVDTAIVPILEALAVHSSNFFDRKSLMYSR